MTHYKIKTFKFYTKKSAIFHFAFCGLFILCSYLFWLKGERQRKLNIKLVESSVRVDVVSLPDKTLQELKSLQKVDPAGSKRDREIKDSFSNQKASEGPKNNDFLTKRKKKLSFKELMKQYSKKSIAKTKKAEKKSSQSTYDQKALANLSDLVKKGNKIQTGSSLVEGNGGKANSIFEKYAGTLPDVIRPYWKIPSFLKEKDLQCRIQVFINSRGEVLKTDVFEQSTVKGYDERAVKAIRLASPLPQPPKEIMNRVLRGDIILGFPL